MKSKLILSLASLFLYSTTVLADEVLETVTAALEDYKNGNFSSAATGLESAAQMVKQQKGQNLSTLLPQPLDGWTATDAKTDSMGAAMFGGMLTTSRNYTKSSSSVKVSIVTDSPMLSSVLMMMSNPMFASSDGGKISRIKGQNAIVKYNAANKDGEISVVVANKFLVTVKGDSAEETDMKAYAEAIDFNKLSSFQ